jgi:hypothetical protein
MSNNNKNNLNNNSVNINLVINNNNNTSKSKLNINNNIVLIQNNNNNNNKSNKQRFDHFGNLIKTNGKQKISFIDKISNKRLQEVIDIESFKQYNILDIPIKQRNTCCLIF